MKITALVQKGNNVLVCFDDGEFISLDYRTVIDNAIRKDDFVDEKKYHKLIFESEFIKAKDSAFRFLGRRHHSTSELRIKLLKKKYSKEIIDMVFQDLTLKNYLNDEEFAKEFSKERIIKKKIGRGKLKAELFKKGIDKKIIDEVISEVDDETSYANVRVLAEKKLKSLGQRNEEPNKIKQKLYAYLTTRGFEFDLINKVIRELLTDHEND